jgi:hypothetical protein
MQLAFDPHLTAALKVFPDLNRMRIVECRELYSQKLQITISRAEAEKRMFAELVAPRVITDIRPLLAADAAAALTTEAVREAFASVFGKLITLLPASHSGYLRPRYTGESRPFRRFRPVGWSNPDRRSGYLLRRHRSRC